MKCALIGLGMVAGTHAAALHATRKVTLAGVLGRDPEKARAFAAQHGGVHVYPDLAALAGDDTLDFVIVATPPDARMDILTALARAGKPVLLEKPMERDAQASAAIAAMFADAGLPLGLVFQHRARQASLALKAALDAGDLGDLVSIEMRVPWWRDQSYYDAPGRGTHARDGGGVVITQAIHTLDLGLWLAGPVRAVQALMRTTPLHRMEAEDWAGALFEFESGASGNLMASTAAYPGGAESLTLQGTMAAAHLEGGVVRITYLDGRNTEIGATAATGGGADPMAFTHDWHQHMIEDFAMALSDNRPPLAPASEAVHVHAVIDAMQRASASGSRQTVTGA